jgi:PAS domain S-box-containing protein
VAQWIIKLEGVLNLVMEQLSAQGQPVRAHPLSWGMLWKLTSLLVVCSAIILTIAIFVPLHRDWSFLLLFGSGLVFCLIAVSHARFLHLTRALYRHTSAVLDAEERKFHAVFEHALDAILILDDQCVCQDANPAASKLFGIPRRQLIGGSIGRFYGHQQDFDQLRKNLLSGQRGGGESLIVPADGKTLFVEFTVQAHFLPARHLMVLHDVTKRRRAEETRNHSLALAKSAWREADALRRATLALTRDLRMDNVLDTLLETLHTLVPYKNAQVLLLETEEKLFLAREIVPDIDRDLEHCPRTIELPDYPILRRALASEAGILIPDTSNEEEWRHLAQDIAAKSWLGVPLQGSTRILGLLCLGHTETGCLSEEDLRQARSLALPAAAAIQNARLYEQAEIYRAELERRLSDLDLAETALEKSEGSRQASEERFQKLFRATPAPLSVTTLTEGRFMLVNEAFERRYGYSSAELIGRTSMELGFWQHAQERLQLVEDLRRNNRIRGRIARFRLKTGEWRVSHYSAEMIQFDSETCLLVVSDDLPESAPQYYQ